MGTVQTTSSVEDLNKITGLVSTANQIDDTVNNNYIISLESEFSALPAGATRVFWNDPLKGGSFTLNANPQPDDGVIWFNGYKRNEEFKPKHTGADVSEKTFDLFKKAVYMDKYNAPIEKVFSEYGATEDDGWSNSEHLITGTKYYFSSSTGDDANDGLSPSTAKKTLRTSRILSSTILPGDGIMFKRGDVWSAETENFGTLSYTLVGTAADNIVFTCYGLGDMPLFDGLEEQLDNITNGTGWTDNGDGTWWTDSYLDPNVKIPNLWINGDIKPPSTTLAGLAGSTDTYWYGDYTNSKLWINFDPTTLLSLKFPSHPNALFLKTGSMYVNYSHLNIQNTRYRSLDLGNGSNITVSNCKLGMNTTTGLTIGANAIVYNNIVDSHEPRYGKQITAASTYPSGGYEGITMYPNKNGEDYSIVSFNTTKNFRHGGITINGSTVVDETTTGNIKMFRNILYLDPNVADYGNRFVLQYDIRGAEVTDNVIFNSVSNQFMGDSNIIKNNLFYKMQNSATKAYNTGGGLVTSIAAGTFGMINNIIDGNVFYKCDGALMKFSSSDYGSISNNTVKRNISFGNGIDKPIYDTNFQNGVQLLFRLNDGSNTYSTENSIIEDNIMFSSYTDKMIAYSTEANLVNESSYYDLESFKVLVDAGITEVSSFERNVNIDISKYTEL